MNLPQITESSGTTGHQRCIYKIKWYHFNAAERDIILSNKHFLPKDHLLQYHLLSTNYYLPLTQRPSTKVPSTTDYTLIYPSTTPIDKFTVDCTAGQWCIYLNFTAMNQQEQLREVLERIVTNDDLHGKWLNSLSMMENTGARKISKYEHPVMVDIVVLKHAAEEARHAYYLKKQIAKLQGVDCPNYSHPYLLAPIESHHYLNMLDVEACRYLRNTLGLEGRDLKHGAYLLVTYSIEVRADMLYGVYQEALTAHNSRVNVKSIIVEEEGHLAEMTHMLQQFHPDWEKMAADMCEVENQLFTQWIAAIHQQEAVLH